MEILLFLRDLRFVFYILIFLPYNFAFGADKTVRITTLEFSPYVSEDLPGNGWAWQIAERALAYEGYKVELTILPWARAVKMVQSGQLDALYLANKNPEREIWASFTEPIGDEISVLFKRRDNEIGFEVLSDLQHYRIVTLNSSHVESILKNQGLNIHSVSNYKFGTNQVFHKRADAFVTDKFVMLHFLRTQMPSKFFQQLDFIDQPVDQNQLHLAVSRKHKDHIEITESFNRGLVKLHASGAYQEILQYYGF